MKPWGRFAIIFIAYGFALLHTAVPHHHPEVSDGQTVISQAGCRISHTTSGLLQLVFSTDLGYGHLETFQKAADPDIVFSTMGTPIFHVTPLTSIPAARQEIRELSAGYIEKLHKRLLLFSSANFRAPPTLSA